MRRRRNEEERDRERRRVGGNGGNPYLADGDWRGGHAAQLNIGDRGRETNGEGSLEDGGLGMIKVRKR